MSNNLVKQDSRWGKHITSRIASSMIPTTPLQSPSMSQHSGKPRLQKGVTENTDNTDELCLCIKGQPPIDACQNLEQAMNYLPCECSTLTVRTGSGFSSVLCNAHRLHDEIHPNLPHASYMVWSVPLSSIKKCSLESRRPRLRVAKRIPMDACWAHVSCEITMHNVVWNSELLKVGVAGTSLIL